MNKQHKAKEHLHPWNQLPAGVRSATITFFCVVIILGCSGLGLPRMLGGWWAIGFYIFQFAFYVFNGLLSGHQRDNSLRIDPNKFKQKSPQYLQNSFWAGIILGIALVVLQFLIGIAVQSTFPISVAFGTMIASAIVLLLMDFSLSVIGALIGGLIYRQWLANYKDKF